MILAVDPGLANVGWCLMHSNGAIHSSGHIQTAKGDRTGDAAARLAEVMFGLSRPLLALSDNEDDSPDVGVVEWPGGASGFQREGAASGNARSAIQTSTTAGAVYGALYWLLAGHTERILTPAPVTWRSALARAWSVQRHETAVHAALLDRHTVLRGLTRKAAPHVRDAAGLAEYGRLMTTKGPTR